MKEVLPSYAGTLSPLNLPLPMILLMVHMISLVCLSDTLVDKNNCPPTEAQQSIDVRVHCRINSYCAIDRI